MSKYSNMPAAQSEFEERAAILDVLGLGLSVDVYSPDLLLLDEGLRRQGILVEYYEVFQAALPALAAVRERLAGRRLVYHGEGLWVSQPDFCPDRTEGPVSEVCAQLRALESQWLNIECAAKQMAGISFGTYLPPLYTLDGAVIAAENAAALQQELDRDFVTAGTRPPLLLLEMPPLTYFACGSLAVPEFYREVGNRAPCGLVLDIGHLWTVYRYTGARRLQSVEQFVAEFLERFPLERVVEIHVAGLAPHFAEAAERTRDRDDAFLPHWIDAHGAPIPDVLFDMLDQVLSHPRLTTLKGLALEVDTKEPVLILSEFQAFRRRFDGRFVGRKGSAPSDRGQGRPVDFRSTPAEPTSVSSTRREALALDYERYTALVTAQAESSLLSERVGAVSDAEGLVRYQRVYLPHEILHWGGDLQDMFPRTCERLSAGAVDLRDFVAFWFERPRAASTPYDFFLMKIECFVEFIESVLPDGLAVALREAEALRAGYENANQRAGFEEMTA
jgi:hypothetical protein